MTETYREHGAICAQFYQLTVDASAVAQFILSVCPFRAGEKALFVGGMFGIAHALHQLGLKLTVVDYSPEMVAVGRQMLPEVRVEESDLRALPYEEEFDYVFVVGRVFTHMISDDDLRAALKSCRRALRAGGLFLFDNYESSKICVTPYFNATVSASDAASTIERASTTTVISDAPFVVRWQARYTGKNDGRSFDFSDSMEHRAWSRAEIAPFLDAARFDLVQQGDNFDETSFYNVARAR